MSGESTEQTLIRAEELRTRLAEVVVLDCRFSLGNAGAGARSYAEGHIPTAHYLHLERDLSGPLAEHGGRHPLPAPADFAARLAGLGIDRSTAVVAYDDNSFAFAARLWWMMRALDYRNVRLLDGGLAAWRAAGGGLDTGTPVATPVDVPVVGDYRGKLDMQAVQRAREAGAQLVDSRDAPRYQGLEEPIDPVAGHIPGALNLPWQTASDDQGLALSPEAQRERLAVLPPDRELVVYCGSGVTACVNLLALEIAGQRGARLYPGSWSDWCSYAENVEELG
ncbi:MAG: sulfurtransferase [Halieaceae bacterium]|nr:sulfurtransferase [Halieaceae bacterium]